MFRRLIWLPVLLGLLALFAGCGSDTTCDPCDECDPCNCASREWVVQYPPLGPGNWYGAWGSSESNVFVVGEMGQIARYNGTSWQNMNVRSSRTVYAIWGASANNIYAVGYNGLVLHYNGTRWDPIYLDTTTSFYSVWGLSATSVYAGAYRYIYYYDGSTWTMMDTGEYYYYHGIWGTSTSNIYAVGSGGTVMHYDGSEWTKVDHGLTTKYLRDIWGTSSSNIYAAGEHDNDIDRNILIHFDGSDWSLVDDPVVDGDRNHYFYDIDGRSASDIYVCSSSDYVLHYNGSSWSILADGTDTEYVALYSLWAGPTNLFTGGNCGKIYIHNGSAWSDETSVPPGTIRDIWAASADNALAVGEDGMILRRDGSSWMDAGTPATDNYEFYGVSGAEDNWFICGSSGALLRNEGSSWVVAGGLGAATNYLYGLWASGNEAVAVGASGVVVRFDGTNQLMMTSGTTYHLRAVWGFSMSDLFAVGDDGTIVHYDGNASNLWTVMESGVSESIDFEGVWGTSHSNVYAVGDDGTIVHYNGSAWSRVWMDTYEDLRAIHGTGPSNVFAVGGNSLFFYDGAGWREMDQDNLSYESQYGVYCISGMEVFTVGGCGSILFLDER